MMKADFETISIDDLLEVQEIGIPERIAAITTRLRSGLRSR